MAALIGSPLSTQRRNDFHETLNLGQPLVKSQHIKPAIPQANARFRKHTLKAKHQWRHSTIKPVIPHVGARFEKHPRRTHVGGSITQAIPHVGARFHKHTLKANISGMTVQPSHPFPMQTLDLRSTQARHASVESQHIRTSYQTHAEDKHQWHPSQPFSFSVRSAPIRVIETTVAVEVL